MIFHVVESAPAIHHGAGRFVERVRLAATFPTGEPGLYGGELVLELDGPAAEILKASGRVEVTFRVPEPETVAEPDPALAAGVETSDAVEDEPVESEAGSEPVPEIPPKE